jgi:hypothetical protein
MNRGRVTECERKINNWGYHKSNHNPFRFDTFWSSLYLDLVFFVTACFLYAQRLTIFSSLISILPPVKLFPIPNVQSINKKWNHHVKMIYIGLKVRNKLIFIVWCDDESSGHKSLMAYPLYDCVVISIMVDLCFMLRMVRKNCYVLLIAEYDARSRQNHPFWILKFLK